MKTVKREREKNNNNQFEKEINRSLEKMYIVLPEDFSSSSMFPDAVDGGPRTLETGRDALERRVRGMLITDKAQVCPGDVRVFVTVATLGVG